MTIDQDGIIFTPIVWFAEGEVVGNMVHCSIREQKKNLVYSWIVTIETALGDTIGGNGISPSLEIAKSEITQKTSVILEGNFMRPKTTGLNWYTGMDGKVRCLHCNTVYQFDGDLWRPDCKCKTNETM